MEKRKERQPYRKPSIKDWGSVEDLTATGLTRPGDDAKDGSVMSEGR